MNIGVLALQGAVAEHINMVRKAGAQGVPVKRAEQLKHIDGIIIPGGESTTIGKLMREYGFIDAIRSFSAAGKPIFGTCAGMILLAKEIVGQEEAHLRLMDITVQRNAFGRQRESFETDLILDGLDNPLRAVFIRAPLINRVGPSVQVLSSINGEVVAAKENHLLVASFHPELTDDCSLHGYFLRMVQESQAAVANRQNP